MSLDHPQLQTIIQNLQAGYPYANSLHELDTIQQTAIAQNDLALNIQCSLIKSSIINTSYHLSGELLAQLVKVGTPKGKWSIEAALAYIDLQPLGQLNKLLILFEHNIPVPWQRALTIVQQANEISGYIALYPLVPSDLQETLVQSIYRSLQQQTVVYVLDILRFIQKISPQWQANFLETILKAPELETSLSYSDWSEAIEQCPSAWRQQLQEKVQTQAQAKLQAVRPLLQQGKYIAFSEIRHYWHCLPPHQQQLLYWFPSLDLALHTELTTAILSSLPQHEQESLLQLFLRVAHDPEQFDNLLINNFLLLHQIFPQHQLLFDTALKLAIAAPQRTNQQTMELLGPDHHEQLARAILSCPPQPTNDLTHSQLRYCLHYLPTLRAELLAAYLAVTSADSFGHYRLKILPYLPAEQQPHMLEQIWQESSRIGDSYQQLNLQVALAAFLNSEQILAYSHTLIQQISRLDYAHLPVHHFISLLKAHPQLSERIYQHLLSTQAFHTQSAQLIKYFAPSQQQTFAQQLFQHLLDHPDLISLPNALKENTALIDSLFQNLSAQQQQQAQQIIQQHTNRDLSIWLLRGLLSIADYPHQTLIPYIEQINTLEYRIALLSALLPRLSTNQQTQLYPVIHRTLQDLQPAGVLWDYHYSPEMLQIVTEHLLQHAQKNAQHLYTLHYHSPASEQHRVRQRIWQQIRQTPISQIAQSYYLLSAYHS